MKAAKHAKMSQKSIDKRIERIYYANCSGVQVDIMDIGKIFAVGRKAIAENADDETLTRVIVEFVETIRYRGDR